MNPWTLPVEGERGRTQHAHGAPRRCMGDRRYCHKWLERPSGSLLPIASFLEGNRHSDGRLQGDASVQEIVSEMSAGHREVHGVADLPSLWDVERGIDTILHAQEGHSAGIRQRRPLVSSARRLKFITSAGARPWRGAPDEELANLIVARPRRYAHGSALSRDAVTSQARLALQPRTLLIAVFQLDRRRWGKTSVHWCDLAAPIDNQTALSTKASGQLTAPSAVMVMSRQSSNDDAGRGLARRRPPAR